MAPTRSDSIAPSNGDEIKRLRRELKEREDAEQERRFTELEHLIEEIRRMVGTHECAKEADLAVMQQDVKDIVERQEKIQSKFESFTRSRFWSILSALVALILAALGAAFVYGANKTNWDYTTKKVEVIENNMKSMSDDMRGVKTSFQLMEASQRETRKKVEKLETNLITPQQIEDAVRKGLKR